MVAKAFTVSRSGVKREARRKKASARERLLATLDGLAFIAPHDAYKRRARIMRALRAHERELAERAADAADLGFTEGRGRHDQTMGAGLRGMSVQHRAAILDSIRAAIIGPQRKRGAR